MTGRENIHKAGASEVSVQGVSKSFQGKTAVSMPPLSLSFGKIYALIGANGSGKSTYARMLAGTLAADDKTKPLPKGVSLGYLPQRAYAFRMSTFNNIAMGVKDKHRAVEAMDLMGISHLKDQNAKRLSGGETARMALARLLARDFNIIILDEPTASMDMESSLRAETMIRRYVQDHNCAALLITHSLPQAERLSDSILFLHEGALVEHGPTQDVLHNPQDERTRAFLNFFGFTS